MSDASDGPIAAGPGDAAADGWASMFAAAFRDSRNAMLLVDEQRLCVDANGAYLQLLGYGRDALVGRPIYEVVAGRPATTPQEWRDVMAAERVTGEVELVRADGSVVAVQWGATPEVVTGRRLVLLVALSTSRWGRRFRRDATPDPEAGALSPREVEVVQLVALGNTGPEIADELLIAPDTVRTHVRNAMTKVGARSRAHLVAKALAEGHALG